MTVTLVDFGPFVWRDAKEPFARVTGSPYFGTPEWDAPARPDCGITRKPGASQREGGVWAARSDLPADTAATPTSVTESSFSTAQAVYPGFLETGDHARCPPSSTTE